MRNEHLKKRLREIAQNEHRLCDRDVILKAIQVIEELETRTRYMMPPHSNGGWSE